MAKAVTGALAVGIWLVASATAAAQPTSPPVVGVTKAEIDAVLKHTGPEGAGVDRQIRVADLGTYQLGVGVLHRGPTKPGAAIAAITTARSPRCFM